MVELLKNPSLPCNSGLSLLCSLAGEMLVAVKQEGLRSLLQEGASSSGEDTNLGSKLINCSFFPLTSSLLCGAAHPHLQGAVSFPTHPSHLRGREQWGIRRKKQTRLVLNKRMKRPNHR